MNRWRFQRHDKHRGGKRITSVSAGIASGAAGWCMRRHLGSRRSRANTTTPEQFLAGIDLILACIAPP
jgi:hypothetical protein